MKYTRMLVPMHFSFVFISAAMKLCNLSISNSDTCRREKRGIIYVMPNEINLQDFSMKYFRTNDPLVVLLLSSPI